MIESAAYEIIRQEGYQEGVKAGIERGIEQGMEQGLECSLKHGRQQGILFAIKTILEPRFEAEGPYELKNTAIAPPGGVKTLHRV